MPACSPCECRVQVPATYPVPPKLNEVSIINHYLVSTPVLSAVHSSDLSISHNSQTHLITTPLMTSPPCTLPRTTPWSCASVHACQKQIPLPKVKRPSSKRGARPSVRGSPPHQCIRCTQCTQCTTSTHTHSSSTAPLAASVWLDVHVHGPTTPSATPPDSHPLVHIGTWGTSSGTPGRPRLTYQDGEIGNRELTVKHGHDDTTLQC